MTKCWQKLAVAIATILGLGAIAVNSAEAASVKLSFFNDADTPLAVGSLSYDESTPYQATFPSTSVGQPALEIKTSDKWFVVKDFAVSIFGLSWDLSKATVGDRASMLSPFLWAPFDSRQLQVVVNSFFPFGSPDPGLWGNWSFGNLRNLPSLTIFGNSNGPGNRMGWLQTGYQSNGKDLNSGYLIAEEVKPCSENSEAVPEPATIAGLTLAAIGLSVAKQKFAASKV